jgi:RNA polymerase sigma factor (sigma-70 family)
MVSHRGHLVRFAQRRLHDPMLAEDVVHDVFEAVLCGRATFAGRSSLRSWLTGILKHKIVDLVRQRAGLESFDDGDDQGNGTIESPQPWPDEVAEQRQILGRTLQRIQALPDGLRAVMELAGAAGPVHARGVPGTVDFGGQPVRSAASGAKATLVVTCRFGADGVRLAGLARFSQNAPISLCVSA